MLENGIARCVLLLTARLAIPVPLLLLPLCSPAARCAPQGQEVVAGLLCAEGPGDVVQCGGGQLHGQDRRVQGKARPRRAVVYGSLAGWQVAVVVAAVAGRWAAALFRIMTMVA